MIPFEFDFHVVNGTGIIFHAKLDMNFEYYNISWDNGQCIYSVKEVLDFLSKGKWREGLI